MLVYGVWFHELAMFCIANERRERSVYRQIQYNVLTSNVEAIYSYKQIEIFIHGGRFQSSASLKREEQKNCIS